MLARLESIDGVRSAAVDYGGNYVRLTIDGDQGLKAATALLTDLGYEPEPGTAHDTTGTWYDSRSVHELSAIEADIIAQRVVGTFVRDGAHVNDTRERLQAAVAAALRARFEVDRGKALTPGQFRRDAIESVREAARGILDDADVGPFVAALEADLEQDHTHDAGL